MVVGLAAATGIAFGAAGTAHADTVGTLGSSSAVNQATANGSGDATVSWTDRSGTIFLGSKTIPAYAMADCIDYNTDYTMDCWLERSTDGGADWSQVSGTHELTSSTSEAFQPGTATGGYYDGPGYLARACFRFTSWSGAAKHCTDGI